MFYPPLVSIIGRVPRGAPAMPDPTPKTGVLPAQDNSPADRAPTQTAGAPLKEEGQGPPAQGAAPRPARPTHTPPPPPPPPAPRPPPPPPLRLALGPLARAR